MRTITKDPSQFVPNLRESDRYENLVIADIKDSDSYQRIACVINSGSNLLNWYGSDDLLNPRRNDSHCYEWGWLINRNLLFLISKSWRHWTSNGNDLKMYIAESPQDVVDALEDAGVTNHGVLLEILEKFPRKATQ